MIEPLKPERKSLKKPLAVAVSLVLHAAALFFLTISSNAHLAELTIEGEGTSDVEGIELDLVGIHDKGKARAEALQTPPQQPNRMNAFMQMADRTLPPDERSISRAEAPSSKPMSLAAALGGNPFQDSHAAPAPRTMDENHVRVDDSNKKTPNDLWKAIEPCWNRIADKNTMSVTLEVSFSPLGNLARPPVIKRDPGANLNDRMLRSENQAITALSQCGPYLMAYGQEGIEIQFPKKKT